MRFLKKKIALAMASDAHKTEAQPKSEPQKTPTMVFDKPNNQGAKVKRTRIAGFSSTSEASRATKNIVKNYGRAICSFAMSHLAYPYLNDIVEREGLLLGEFLNYMKEIRTKIDGLFHFRSTILISPDDSQDLAAKKRALVEISEVFIKFYSVNWIYNSRVFHKEAHLKFRFKMLRRIKNPELFTYLKECGKDKKKSHDDLNL